MREWVPERFVFGVGLSVWFHDRKVSIVPWNVDGHWGLMLGLARVFELGGSIDQARAAADQVLDRVEERWRTVA
jgi:hypothetical protein